MPADVTSYVSIRAVLREGLWPEWLVDSDAGDILDGIAYIDGDLRGVEGNVQGSYLLRVVDEVSLPFPLLDGSGLVFGSGDVQVDINVVEGNWTVQLTADVLSLRFSRALLRPAIQLGESWVPDLDEDHFVEIELPVMLSATSDGDLDISILDETAPSLSLPRCFVGNTGVQIEADDVIFHFVGDESIPAQYAGLGLPQGWIGLLIERASVSLPPEMNVALPNQLAFEHCAIGSGGFSGTVSADWAGLSGQLFGIDFVLKHFEITFAQNAIVGSAIRGDVTLPFFAEPVSVDIGFLLDGGLTVQLANTGPGGLVTLTKAGILTIALDSIAFELEHDVFTTKISGDLTPLFGADQGLKWPTFHVNELSIDSKGNVKLEGGWLNLPAQYHLDFHGFHIEITKLGFGKSDDGGKWMGFSGAVKLVDGMQAGASVEGLRITWYDDGRTPPVRISLNGVGVEFEIPKVLRFKGAVSYREFADPVTPSQMVRRFDGDIELNLVTLNMTVHGTVVFGTASSGAAGRYSFMALYVDAELPAGIPLFATGVALYGMAGLFAVQMEPDKHSNEEWYGVSPTEGWYHRSTVGITDITKKWRNQKDSYAFGAGVTLGTAADNGYAFNAKTILVIVFPGPILLLEGRGNLMKKRAALSEEPLFRALAVLDGRAGSLLVGLDAHYKYDSGGGLIDIAGGAEAFFSFHDASLWHLYLGERTPQERRIHATLAKLFTANAYFMLDARSLAVGAWIGWDKSWDFGPVNVSLGVWIEGNALVSWRPTHLHGDLWLHGSAEVSVFGFGVGLTIDARLSADVFDPFHLLGELEVGISLPWPLKDISVDVRLEWGPRPVAPGIPVPLKEVAIEHFLSTTSWPLPRTALPTSALLFPDYDDGAGLIRTGVGNHSADPPPSAAPVVPMDCRPHLTFGRPVHDDALVGVNAQPVVPVEEPVGDPTRGDNPVTVRYGLKEVALYEWHPPSWVLVARKGSTANVPSTLPKLYGSWAPMPQMPNGTGTNVGQVKLWLWSATPFDYSRHSGRDWDEGFTNQLLRYPPCVVPPPDELLCCDFADLTPGQVLTPPWACPDVPGLLLSWLAAPEVRVVSPPVQGLSIALCFPSTAPGGGGGTVPNEIQLTLPPRAKRVTLLIADQIAQCVYFTGRAATQGLANPYAESGATFLSRSGGVPKSHNRIIIAQTTGGPLSGLDCRTELEIALPQDSSFAELTVTSASPPASVQAFRPNGDSAGTVTVSASGHETTVRFTHGPIKRLVILAPQGGTVLHHVCYDNVRTSPAQAVGIDGQNQSVGPVFVVNRVLSLSAEGLTTVLVTSPEETCILQICVTIAPLPEAYNEEQMFSQHTVDEVARLYEIGNVLKPHTKYRLTVVTRVVPVAHTTIDNLLPATDLTEHAYFRTDGPPGLAKLSLPPNLTTYSVPAGPENPDDFSLRDAAGLFVMSDGKRVLKTDLNTLVPYVRQTTPPTVPAPGEKPPLPRPVYRAYDVGAEFNVDYVDLMYRLAGRDLGLYLYDRNNLPVRDAAGRLIVLTNRWGATEQASLTEGEERWISQIDSAGCVIVSADGLSRDRALASAADGLVLDADTLYEARLVPLLVHEDFSGDAVGAVANPPASAVDRWQVADVAVGSGSSLWTVGQAGTPPSRYIEQTHPIGQGSIDPTDPVKPGSLLVRTDDPALPSTHPEQPRHWTDYRLSVLVRSNAGGALGVAFRYGDPQNHYLFVMDHDLGYRRLVRVTSGAWHILAGDAFAYQTRRDYLVTITAVGASVQVYLDGALVFDVTDAARPDGGVAFYSWRNESARFSDLRVDDFGASAPVVYRFAFTTSAFATFFHHLHSFNDETWRVLLATNPGLAPWFARAVLPSAPLSTVETHAYEDLANAVLGADAQQDAPQVEVTRVELGSEAVAMIVRGPEPIDWKRTALTLHAAADLTPGAAVPGELKLTDVIFADSQPSEEIVTLVARSTLDPTGYRVESLLQAGPLTDPVGDPVLLSDRFIGPDAGLLYREAFGARALDGYAIVDRGNVLGPSHWEVVGGEIVSRRRGSAVVPPETFATLTASGAWPNVTIQATLRSDHADAFGLVCRYRSPDDCYLLRFDRTLTRRQFVRRVAGVEEVLWKDTVGYQSGQSYAVTLEVFGKHFLATIDNVVLFSLEDSHLPIGQCGVYATLTTEVHVAALSVEARETAPVLTALRFADLSELEIIDAALAIDGPSIWSADAAILSQSSNIRTQGASADNLGTIALFGNSAWSDVEISLTLESSTPGTVGVAFRHQESGDGYRFSLDSVNSLRRLIKVIGGTSFVLRSDSTVWTGDVSSLTLRAEGNRLRVFLDGALLYDVTDNALTSGRVGLFTAACPGAQFSQVVVADRPRRVGQWTVVDEGATGGPSVWQLRSGVLTQTSPIGGGVAPASPGTIALGGDPAWKDYRVTVRMRSDDAAPIGVVFRFTDLDNYYRLSVDPASGNLTLIAKTAGVVSVLWSGSQPAGTGSPFILVIDAQGSRLRGYLADQRLFEVSDTAHASGRVGLYCADNAGARFEHVEARLVPQEARALLDDRFTGENPAGWTLAAGGTRAIAGDPAWADIAWTARTSPYGSVVAGVVLRYLDENNFYQFDFPVGPGSRQLVKVVGGVASLLWEDAVGSWPATSSEITVIAVGSTLRGFIDRVPMFVVDDASLTAGRVGLFAADEDPFGHFTSARALPASEAFDQWLIDDPFTSLVPGRWTFLDAGDQSGPSQWAVLNGEMVQTSAIRGGTAGQPDQPGTAALAGNPEWTDYRVTARLRSDGNGVIGVYARYRDQNHHYLLAMDHTGAVGTRRLIKKVGGVVSVLHQDAVVPIAGREYVITIDCRRDKVEVFLDGLRWCAITDADLASGQIGLYCWENPGAHWAEIRVAAPSWTTYYRFTEDDPVAAGTRLVLTGGNANDPPAPGPIPGVLLRRLAVLDAHGQLLLPRDGVWLRVTAPDNTPEAERRFLPPADYTPITSLKVLRKADGTAFVLILPDGAAATGSLFAPGTYRIQLTYLRDNRASDSSSPVYSQVGDRSPEHVTLDVPWQAN